MFNILEKIHEVPSQVQGTLIEGARIAVISSSLLQSMGDVQRVSPGIMVLSLLGGLAIGRILSSGRAAQPVNHVPLQSPSVADRPIADSAELIELVDTCARERNIRKPVNLYYSDKIELLATGWTSSHGHSLYVNPDTKEFLTKEEMRFAIEHELTHINRHDSIPRLDHAAMKMMVHAGIFSGFLGVAFGSTGIEGVGFALVSAEALHLFDRMEGRVREQRTDLVAVDAVGDAKGAISLFEKIPAIQKKCAEKRNIHPDVEFEPRHPINKFIMRVYAEHPSCQRRIARLKEWQKQKSSLANANARKAIEHAP